MLDSCGYEAVAFTGPQRGWSDFTFTATTSLASQNLNQQCLHVTSDASRYSRNTCCHNMVWEPLDATATEAVQAGRVGSSVSYSSFSIFLSRSFDACAVTQEHHPVRAELGRMFRVRARFVL